MSSVAHRKNPQHSVSEYSEGEPSFSTRSFLRPSDSPIGSILLLPLHLDPHVGLEDSVDRSSSISKGSLSPIGESLVIVFGQESSLRVGGGFGSSAESSEREKRVSQMLRRQKREVRWHNEPDDSQNLRPNKCRIESSGENLIEMIPIVVDELLVGDELSFGVVVPSRVVDGFEDGGRRLLVVEFIELIRVDCSCWTC